MALPQLRPAAATSWCGPRHLTKAYRSLASPDPPRLATSALPFRCDGFASRCSSSGCCLLSRLGMAPGGRETSPRSPWRLTSGLDADRRRGPGPGSGQLQPAATGRLALAYGQVDSLARPGDEHLAARTAVGTVLSGCIAKCEPL